MFRILFDISMSCICGLRLIKILFCSVPYYKDVHQHNIIRMIFSVGDRRRDSALPRGECSRQSPTLLPMGNKNIYDFFSLQKYVNANFLIFLLEFRHFTE